jgi:hypothetical protein
MAAGFGGELGEGTTVDWEDVRVAVEQAANKAATTKTTLGLRVVGVI